jgi:hypothetical protein
LLSRRSGLDNNRRRRRRTRRQLQVHQFSPVLPRNNHRVLQGNRARCNPVLNLRGPLANRLRVCRRAHQECHRPVPLALLLQDQLLRVPLSLPR